MKVLIVDDEVYARKRLRRFLQAESSVELLSDCATGAEAVCVIKEQKPDLVLLDIQLPDMSGFDVIDAVGVENMPAIIFVTAHDEFALKAFEAHAFGYLLKPFDQQRLHDILRRTQTLLSRRKAAEMDARLEGLLHEFSRHQYLSRLCVRTDGRVLFILVGEVEWIEAFGNYVHLHLGEQQHLLRSPLSRLENKLNPEQFVRVHRSAIVNVDRIREVQPYFGGNHAIILKSGAKLIASRSGMQRLQMALGNAEA